MHYRPLLLALCLGLPGFAAPTWSPSQWPGSEEEAPGQAYQAQPYALRALEEFTALDGVDRKLQRARLTRALMACGSYEEALGVAFESVNPEQRSVLVGECLDTIERERGTQAAADFAPVLEHTLTEDGDSDFRVFLADRLHRLLARADRTLEAEVFAQRQAAHFEGLKPLELAAVRAAEAIAGLAREGQVEAARMELNGFLAGGLSPAANAPNELSRAAGSVYLGLLVDGQLDDAQTFSADWRLRGVTFDDDIRSAALAHVVRGELDRERTADALTAARTAARELRDNGPLLALIESAESPDLLRDAQRALTQGDVPGWSAARRAGVLAHARMGDHDRAKEAGLGLPLESRNERLELAWGLAEKGAYDAAKALTEGRERDVVALWQAEATQPSETWDGPRAALETDGLWPRVELLGHFVRTGDRQRSSNEAKQLFRTYIEQRASTDPDDLRKLLRLEMSYGGGFLIELAAEEIRTPKERLELFLQAVEALLDTPGSDLP